ncbi:hypothetical protein CH293_22515 [Rhodococcus sp. 14-2470-1b]|nr:hypothetical protein CH293_22515 [Rhodococcus sp. 14-2470-1b]
MPNHDIIGRQRGKRFFADTHYQIRDSVCDNSVGLSLVCGFVACVPVRSVILQSDRDTACQAETHVQMHSPVARQLQILLAASENKIQQVENLRFET